MCGIVGAIGERDITPILIGGLRRLESRGCDSAGIALRGGAGSIQRIRSVGPVAWLQARMEGALTVSRARQVSLKGYNRPRKESK